MKKRLPRYRTGDPILPSESEAEMAEASSHELADYLEKLKESGGNIKLMLDEREEKVIEVPQVALELLLEILVHTAQGKPVKITPYPKKLHTYQIANILGMRNRQVWELMDAGEIAYEIIHNCRMSRYEDIMEYKKQYDEKRNKIMDEIVAESQAMGLYD